MTKRIVFPLVFGLLVVLAGCNRELDPEPADLAYYPMVDQKTRTYFVIDTGFTTTDTIAERFYLQERTNGYNTDLEDREIMRLELWRADADSNDQRSSGYTFDRLWSQYRDIETAERIQGNVRYVVCNFPLREGQTWNGNAFNDEGDERYEVLVRDTTVTLMGQTYDDCIYIEQRKQQSLISDIFTYEIYAPNIGKIERYDRFLRIKTTGGPDAGEIETDSYIYHERLVDEDYTN